MIPFSANDRGDQDVAGGKDVPDQNIGRVGRGMPQARRGNLNKPFVDARDEVGDLGFVGIADYEGNSWECGEFLGSALSIAAGYQNFGGWILLVNFADSVAGLGIRGGSHGAGVDDNELCVESGRRGRAATIAQLALDGSAVGLSGAAAELLDEESGHSARKTDEKI